MDNVRDALLRMYRVAKMAKRYDAVFEGLDTPYFRIYGEAVDAIYSLIGEHTETLEESETYNILHTQSLTEDRAVALLMNVYEKNNTPPKPHVHWVDSMADMVKANGGYLHETPEGDWK